MSEPARGQDLLENRLFSAGTAELVVPLYSSVAAGTNRNVLEVPLYSSEITGRVQFTGADGVVRSFSGHTTIKGTLVGDAVRGEYIEEVVAVGRDGLAVPLYSAPTGVPFRGECRDCP